MFKDSVDETFKGKYMAYKMTCEVCKSTWINMINFTFNVGCLKCFDKKTVKTVKRVWITVEPCTELDEIGDSFDN